jgi:hypothetical protein
MEVKHTFMLKAKKYENDIRSFYQPYYPFISKMMRKPKKEPPTLKVLFRNYKGSYKPTLEFDDPAIGDEFN